MDTKTIAAGIYAQYEKLNESTDNKKAYAVKCRSVANRLVQIAAILAEQGDEAEELYIQDEIEIARGN